MRRINIKELEHKIEFLKQSIDKDKIDLVYWLDEFSPDNRLNFPYDSNQKLSSEEHNKRTREWTDYHKKHYKPLQKTMLNRVFTQIESKEYNLDNAVKISELLLLLCKARRSNIRKKAATLIKSFDLTAVIPKIIEGIASSDENEAAESIRTLESLKLYGNEWKDKGLLIFNNDLILALKSALSKKYDPNSSPYFSFFLIMDQLSKCIPKEISALQEELIDLTDYDKLGYRNYESIMYMYENCWKYLKEYWTEENIKRLQTKVYTRAKKEYKKGDHWVEQYILSTLIIIGEGNQEAEKVIAWLKEEYNMK